MNYEDKTDFEINKLVAEELYPDYEWFAVDPEIDRGHGDSVAAWDGGQSYVYDYCGLVDNSWPIIVEHRINIIAEWPGKNWYCNVTPTVATIESYRDKNPLRCAMIVFLKMKEQ